ncbi:MAG: nucleotidyltransferase domain-containing protein [Candidatus Pacearchaeota archaeon]
MIQKYIKYNVLSVFFNSPTKGFQIREISRLIKLGQPSVTNYLKALEKEGFIIKDNNGIYPSFKANRENNLFRLYKKFDMVFKINSSGLLDYLYNNCLPSSIILFGSASKGEDIESSDIDIFIQSKEKKLNLEKYEKILNRKISLFFEQDFNKISNELKNNILNGVVLNGYIKVF